MAYIKHIQIKPNKINDDFYEYPIDVSYSQFMKLKDRHKDKLSFVTCTKDYEYRYLFKELFDPQKGIDETEMALIFEQVSPIFIFANAGPILIHNSTFRDNIGTTGGAINILAPNFNFNRNPKTLNVTRHMNNSLPVVMIKENRFERNMAYFSGNAFSIINTLAYRRNYIDYLQFCGAGIEIS